MTIEQLSVMKFQQWKEPDVNEVPYLDYCSTTPVCPQCVAAMEPFWTSRYANPSSSHTHGKDALNAVNDARTMITNAITSEHDDGRLILTSGATESNNLAIVGAIGANASRKHRHVVVSGIEHPSVLEPARRLKDAGLEVSLARVSQDGVVDMDHLMELIRRPDTVLVSIMLANHETGVIQPIDEIARACRSRGVILHTDAAQYVGKLPIDVSRLGVQLVTFSAHKLYGPKGIGGLYVRDIGDRPVALRALTVGGGQESGYRPGTIAVPLVVGFAAACEMVPQRIEEHRRLKQLRDDLESRLRESLEDIVINGEESPRLPHVSSISFPGIAFAENWIKEVQEKICISSGSACASGSRHPSHVLAAMGVSRSLALATLRISLGIETTTGEIDVAVDAICRSVKPYRHLLTRGRSCGIKKGT